MKYKKKLFLLLISILACFFLFSGTAFARAGGGGSSSSGGGGGSSGSHSGSHYYGRGTDANPIAVLLPSICTLLLAGSGSILFAFHVTKARRKSRQLMKAYKELGIEWDYRAVQKYIEKAYFEIQECWRRYDPSYAEAYLSEELAEEWRIKLEWMKLRNEEIVQKNVKLLRASPVYVCDEAGEENDRIWYLIHGKMIGYYRDRTTKRLIRGNPRPEAFYEYWLFIRRNGRWVLHEIRQKDEMDIREFLN